VERPRRKSKWYVGAQLLAGGNDNAVLKLGLIAEAYNYNFQLNGGLITTGNNVLHDYGHYHDIGSGVFASGLTPRVFGII